MAGWNVDLTAIAAIWMGGVILLLPLTGAVIRFGLVPLLIAFSEYRRSGRGEESEAEMRARLVALEARLEQLESNIDGSTDSRHAMVGAA